MKPRGISHLEPVPLDPWRSTFTLLGHWPFGRKLVTCALVSQLTVTLMCMKLSVILNIHYLKGKNILNTRALICFHQSRILYPDQETDPN